MADASELRERIRSVAERAVPAAADAATQAVRDHRPELARWDYGQDPRPPFPPHVALDGCVHAGSDDPALATAATDAEQVGGHFAPQDHTGCLCRTLPADVTARPAGPLRAAVTLDPTGPDGSEPIAVRRGRTLLVLPGRAGVTDRAADEFHGLLADGWAGWLTDAWRP
ncbi:MAG: hypothetical protein IPM45_18365 [Acidimicrobiales bacterium]|nr:hypothetical protein [Acidimicrobiales bacterium]